MEETNEVEREIDEMYIDEPYMDWIGEPFAW